MRVIEIFYSLQGEGFLTGVPSTFVRLAGCPLRCKWCDTKYAWSEDAGYRYSIEQIISQVNNHSCRYVVITGGEPMINPELPELVNRLKIAEKHITIETAGIAFMPEMPCDLMSISPKLSNSVPYDERLTKTQSDSTPDIAVLYELIANYDYQLKFVIDSQNDLPEVQETIRKIGNVNPEKVMLMPQAVARDELLDKSPMVADLCKRSGYTFCQRMQIILWNNQKGC